MTFATTTAERNAVLGQGEGPIAPLPYAVKATSKGLEVSYSAFRRIISDDHASVSDTWATDLNIGAITSEGDKAAATVLDRSVAAADSLMMTMSFGYEEAVGGGKVMLAHLARGSPYVTVEFEGGAMPFIASVWPIKSFAPIVLGDDVGAEDDTATPAADHTCAGNVGCAAAGLLAGDCCPAPNGMVMDCCAPSSR